MACFRTRWLLIFVGAAAAGAMATAAARQGRFQAANTARHALRARDAELTREQGALMPPPDWDAPVDSDAVVIVPSLLAVDAPDSVLTGRDGGGCDDDEEDGQEAAWQHGEELLADADVPMAPPLATAQDPAPMAEALASNGVRRAIFDAPTGSVATDILEAVRRRAEMLAAAAATTSQAREGRAADGAADDDEEAELAEAQALEDQAKAVAEDERSFAVVHAAPLLGRRAAVHRLPCRKTQKLLQSLTRFWYLYLEKRGVVVESPGPTWGMVRAAPRRRVRGTRGRSRAWCGGMAAGARSVRRVRASRSRARACTLFLAGRCKAF